MIKKEDFVNIIILGIIIISDASGATQFNSIQSDTFCSNPLNAASQSLVLWTSPVSWKSTHDHHRNCKCIKLKIIIFENNAVHFLSLDWLHFPPIDQGFSFPKRFISHCFISEDSGSVKCWKQLLFYCKQ